MRLNEFQVGDKVHIPGAPESLDKSLYSTIKYIGETIAVLEPQNGGEFSRDFEEDAFEPYDENSLENLGDDLVRSIEDAAWENKRGEPNLEGPTWHMQEAVRKWKEKRNV